MFPYVRFPEIHPHEVNGRFWPILLKNY